MEDVEFVCDSTVLQFKKATIPMHKQIGSSIFLGIWQNTDVIIKVVKNKKNDGVEDDPHREHNILAKTNQFDERIFMKLIAFIHTRDEVLFVLEKAACDLHTFMHYAKSPSTKQSIYLIFLLAKLVNRMHIAGITHGDISLENIAVYSKPNEVHLAFIDAGQAQEPDFTQEFHVNVPEKPHIFDRKHIGK